MKTKKVTNWTYEYCESMAADWHDAAQVICDNLPENIDCPTDAELWTIVKNICKEKGYDIKYMPESISFTPVFGEAKD